MIQGLENSYCTCALGPNITRWTMQTSLISKTSDSERCSVQWCTQQILSAAFFTVRVNNQWKKAFQIYTNNPLFLENSGHYMAQNVLHFMSMHGSQTMIGWTKYYQHIDRISSNIKEKKFKRLLYSSHVHVFIVIVLKAGKSPDTTWAWR